MGGLVCRKYCATRQGADNVLALFLIGSPSIGRLSHSPFSRATGAPRRRNESWASSCGRRVVHSSAGWHRRFMRNMPSLYQLLPTVSYGMADPFWARFDATLTGYEHRHSGPPPYRIENEYRFSNMSEQQPTRRAQRREVKFVAAPPSRLQRIHMLDSTTCRGCVIRSSSTNRDTPDGPTSSGTFTPRTHFTTLLPAATRWTRAIQGRRVGAIARRRRPTTTSPAAADLHPVRRQPRDMYPSERRFFQSSAGQ